MNFRYITFSIVFVFHVFNVKAQVKIPPERPKLVVGIVIDQMRYDYIYRFWDKFGDNGFKKLFNEGTFCNDAHYDYLLTESAPGYATIVTGTNPSHHGIVSNQWYLRLRQEIKYCVRDQSFKSVGFSNESGKVSPSELISSTIGDELRLSNFKQSKVFCVSLNDYAAVLSGGNLANGAYWFDDKSGNWVSSSFYHDFLPNWVNDFNAKKFTDIYLNRTWELFKDEKIYTQSLADKNSYEKGFDGGRNTFPYPLNQMRKTNDYTLLKYTPFGNTYVKDFALSVIVSEMLGKDTNPDFLTIGFSSTGFVSDIFGIRSMELEDVYLRLDEDLAHLLTALNELVGKENVLVYITSDRGANDSPAFLHDVKMPGEEFNMKSALALLRSYLKAIYGEGNWIQAYFNQQLYLNQALIEDSKIPLDEMQQRVAQFLVQFTGISNAVSASTFQTTNFTSGMQQKFQNSYNQKRSGDVIISYAPGWTEVYDSYTDKSLSSHGTAYSYDSHVPLIWYGWKIKRVTINRRISITDIAPTLSVGLKIAYPNNTTGTPILELFQF